MVKPDNLPVQQNYHFVVQADIDPLIAQAEKVYVALRNWRTYEELPRELGSVNYTECIEAVKNKLIPIFLPDAQGIIITFVNTCKAFGWISDPSTLETICEMYYETLSHLPEEFFRDTLRIVLKTWTHGQYLKMPSPAFLKDSISGEYYRLHHVKQKLEVAQMVSDREKKRKPPEDQNLVKFDPALYVPFMKKVEE
jgi:hypothetical protein